MKTHIADHILFSPAYETCLLDGKLALGTYSKKDGGYIALPTPWAVEKIQCPKHNKLLGYRTEVQVAGKMTLEQLAWWKIVTGLDVAQRWQNELPKYFISPIEIKPNGMEKEAVRKMTADEALAMDWTHHSLAQGNPTDADFNTSQDRAVWILRHSPNVFHLRRKATRAGEKGGENRTTHSAVYNEKEQSFTLKCKNCTKNELIPIPLDFYAECHDTPRLEL